MILYPAGAEGQVRRWLTGELAERGHRQPVYPRVPNPRPPGDVFTTLRRAETAMRHRFAQDLLFVAVCWDPDERRVDEAAQLCLSLLLSFPATGLAQWAEHVHGPSPHFDPDLPGLHALKTAVSITFPARQGRPLDFP